MKITNQSNNAILAENAVVAATFLSRIIGLLDRKELLPGQALVIRPCNSVHTFFMRFAIDVVFVDKGNKVVRAINTMRPFRISSVYFSSFSVVELPAGTLRKTSTREGDVLEFNY